MESEREARKNIEREKKKGEYLTFLGGGSEELRRERLE